MTALGFFPSNPLERILARAAEDPSARPEFYRLLLESQLYFLTPDAPASPGARIAGDAEPLRPATIDVAGATVVPMFTSVDRIKQLALGARAYAGVRGQAAFEMLAQQPDRAVLNPGFSCGKEFETGEIRALADGTFFEAQEHTVPAGSEILIGHPASPPATLLSALSSFFANEEAVAAAYLAQVHEPASGALPHLLVGVDCRGDFMAVAGRIGALLREIDLAGDPVDVAQVTPDAFGGYFQRDARPFYVRKRA